MKKTISISIAGEVFYIEEDAYNKLDSYLEAIKKKFSKDGEKEVVDDIESAIAEGFIRQSKGRERLLSLEDIEEMIETMGTVEDIVGEDETSAREESEEEDKCCSGRRIYRDKENKMIAGVCSGLGSYFDIDPTILRILFILLAFLNGIGIVAYVVLWLAIPEAKTASDRLMMKGEKVTIEGIREVAEDRVPNRGETVESGIGGILHKITEIFAVIANALLKLIKILIKVFFKVLGFVLVVAGIFAVFGIIFGFGFGAMGSSALIIKFFASFGGLKAALLAILAFIIAVLPLLFLIFIGSSMMARKPMFRLSGVIAGLVIWLLAIGGCLAIVSVKYGTVINERANAPIISKTYDLDKFDSVDIGNLSKVSIEKGETASVTVNGTDRGISQMKAEVRDGKLTLTRSGNVNDEECPFCWFVVDNNRPVEVDIIVPELHSISAGNTTNVTISGFDENDLLIQAENASRWEINDVNIKKLTLTAKDVSSIEAVGSGDEVAIIAKDASRINLMRFPVHKADVSAYNVASVKINADLEVSVMKEGPANVSYIGNPAIKEIKVRRVESKDGAVKDSQETNINPNNENSAQ